MVQAQNGAAPQTPVTGQAPGAAFTTPGPRVDLPIEDAVARAMERNIDISVARITPQLQDFTLAGLEANYRVNLTSTISNNKATDLPRVTTQGISAPTTSVREAWSAGIAQNVWKGGGNYTLNWTNSRFNSPSSVNNRNPPFQSGLVANYTQPLWRGFKIDVTGDTRAGFPKFFTTANDADGIELNGVNVTVTYATVLPVEGVTYAAGELKTGEAVVVYFNVTVL
jgi:hypothetical protein